jgi:hypothetical protein
MKREAYRMLGVQIFKRLTNSGGIILVNALGVWTDEYFGLVQGLCIALLTFIIVKQLDRDQAIHPKLLKRVCVLYCNRQTRKLFIANDNTPASIFSDLLLAVGMAVAAIILYDDTMCDPSNTAELKQMLEGLLFLYGDIMDFVFQYGVLKITVCAFVLSIYLRGLKPPQTQLGRFGLRLASIINANLLSQGLTTWTPSFSPELRIFQCLAATCVLRLLLPDMQFYLTFLAAQQLRDYFPNAAPIFFCITVCLDLLPSNSQEWVSEICFTYVLVTLAASTASIPFWGMVFILVMAHYTDYIITASSQK